MADLKTYIELESVRNRAGSHFHAKIEKLEYFENLAKTDYLENFENLVKTD